MRDCVREPFEKILAAYKADRATLRRLEEWAKPQIRSDSFTHGYENAKAEVREFLKGEAGS